MAGGDREHSPTPQETPDGAADEAVERPPTRPPGRRLRRVTASLVVFVLLLAGASYRFDLGARWLGWEQPSPLTSPSEVEPPPGLTLPEMDPAAAVAEDTQAPAADPLQVRRAVARLVTDPKLGRRVAVTVVDLADGTTLYESGPATVTPASTVKVLTAAAALEVLGPDHRFRTRVVAGGRSRDIVLVGGGDPLLARTPDPDAYPARADLDTLAHATAKRLRSLGRTRVRLGYDPSLFTGPAVSPDWPDNYLPDDVVSPISPLWVDEGRERTGMADRSRDPSAAAARVFADALEAKDITVVGKVREVSAPEDADELAFVEGAPLEQVAQWTLEVSDNEAAEVLLRHVARAEGRRASFTGGAAAVRSVLERWGVDTGGMRLHDGSGLSRANRLAPRTLAEVLLLAADEEHPRLRRVVTGLPVAGFTGSLGYRFDSAPDEGLGRVRAKTGTLSGVHGLAGVVTTVDGVELAFVVVADRVRLANTLDARAGVDRVAAALARCTCAAAG